MHEQEAPREGCGNEGLNRSAEDDGGNQIMNAETFIEQFNATQKTAHDINVANGWWYERLQMMDILKDSGKFTPEALRALLGIHLIGLIHTEPSEAVESLRKPTLPIDSTEPHSCARELAGTIIRIMDMAEVMGIPVAAGIVEEIKCNAGRGKMHGGNVA